MPPVKRASARRSVRHSKAYWRKGADVSGIDEQLELNRLDERLGLDSAALSKTKEADLFTIDRGGALTDDEIKVEPGEMVTRRRKRTVTSAQMRLKYLEKLKSDSKVAAIEGREAINPTKVLVTAQKVHNKESRQGALGRKANLKRRHVDGLFKLIAEDNASASAKVDLWDEKEVEMNYIEDWFARQTRRKGAKRHVIRNRMDVKTNLPSVVEPGAHGSSYNPSHPEHQAQLKAAVAVEQRKEHSEQAVHKATYVKPETKVTAKDVLEEEMSGLIAEPDGAIDLDEFESDIDEVLKEGGAKTSAANKATKRQRRRAVEEKRRVSAKTKSKTMNMRENQVYSLRRINKELRAQEAISAERSTKRIGVRQTRAARFGRHAFEEPDLAVALTEELVGTLRELKPEGDVLHERWKSLQQRNVIAPTKRVKRPKSAPSKKVQSRDVRAMIERLGGEAAKYNHEVVNQGFH